MDGTLLFLNLDIDDIRRRLSSLFKEYDVYAFFEPLLPTIYDVAEKLSRKGHRENELLKQAFDIIDEVEVSSLKGAQVRQGVREALKNLERYPLGVVSNNGKKCVNYALRMIGLPIEIFDVIITREDVRKHKPSPDPLLLALRELMKANPNLQNVIYIGDHVNDVICGKEASSTISRERGGAVITVAITGGLCSFDDLYSSGPNYLINDFSELIALLRVLESENG